MASKFLSRIYLLNFKGINQVESFLSEATFLNFIVMVIRKSENKGTLFRER